MVSFFCFFCLFVWFQNSGVVLFVHRSKQTKSQPIKQATNQRSKQTNSQPIKQATNHQRSKQTNSKPIKQATNQRSKQTNSKPKKANKQTGLLFCYVYLFDLFQCVGLFCLFVLLVQRRRRRGSRRRGGLVVWLMRVVLSCDAAESSFQWCSFLPP